MVWYCLPPCCVQSVVFITRQTFALLSLAALTGLQPGPPPACCWHSGPPESLGRGGGHPPLRPPVGVVWLCGARCVPAATHVQGRTGRSGGHVCPCCVRTRGHVTTCLTEPSLKNFQKRVKRPFELTSMVHSQQTAHRFVQYVLPKQGLWGRRPAAV